MKELWNNSEFWRILINILGVTSIIVAVYLLYISYKMGLKFFIGKKIKELKTDYATLYELPEKILKNEIQLGFDLPDLMDIRFSVNDVNDNEIKVICEGSMKAGEHVFLFNTKLIEDGEYFLNFSSNYQTINKKIIIKN